MLLTARMLIRQNSEITSGHHQHLIGVVSRYAERREKNRDRRQGRVRRSRSRLPSRVHPPLRRRAPAQHHCGTATSDRPQDLDPRPRIADALAHASYMPVMDGDYPARSCEDARCPAGDFLGRQDRPSSSRRAQGRHYLLQLTSRTTR